MFGGKGTLIGVGIIICLNVGIVLFQEIRWKYEEYQARKGYRERQWRQ